MDADWGTLLSVGWKWLGKRTTYVLSLADFDKKGKDLHDDKDLVAAFATVLKEADLIVGHYSSKFDLPYVNAKLLEHGLAPVPSDIPHIDTWRVARYKLKLSSNRLQNICEWLGLPDKTPIKKAIWKRAARGDRKSLKYICQHNRQDVVVLELAYNRLLPLITKFPCVRRLYKPDDLLFPENCQRCGSNEYAKEGPRYYPTKVAQRWQCKKCGSYTETRLKCRSQLN